MNKKLTFRIISFFFFVRVNIWGIAYMSELTHTAAPTGSSSRQ